MNITVVKFEHEKLSRLWDSFIDKSKNGLFLFKRSFMDYHQDRFEDHSLLFYEGNQLIAVLPANIIGDTLYSHQGLTFGGFITDHTMKQSTMFSVVSALKYYMTENDIKQTVYKSIPSFFTNSPSEEEHYVFFNSSVECIKVEASSGVNLNHTRMPGKKLNGSKRAGRLGLVTRYTDDPSSMMEICQSNLNDKYGVAPVHTSKELMLLAKNNKNCIRFIELYDNDEDRVRGGAIIFLYGDVVHTQYLITDDLAKKNRGLDLLVKHLYGYLDKGFIKISFGISTENSGRTLNEGLIKQKEEYGASTFCHITYQISVN